MAYVALSRVQNINNVYIIDFNLSVLKCNEKCVIEYNRLKRSKVKFSVI